MDGVDLQWVERLGGWGAILLIVRWMMARLDKMIDSFQSAVVTFGDYEAEGRAAHNVIIEQQKRILDSIKEIAP